MSFEELLRLFGKSSDKNKEKDKNEQLCKDLTTKISREIRPEIRLVDSEKHLSIIIEDILLSDSDNIKQIQKAIDKENLVQKIIELAKINL